MVGGFPSGRILTWSGVFWVCSEATAKDGVLVL